MGGDPPTRSLQAAWGVRGLPLPRPVISWLERGKSASCFWSALPFGKRFCTCFSPVMTSRRAGAVNTAEGRGSVMPSDLYRLVSLVFFSPPSSSSPSLSSFTLSFLFFFLFFNNKNKSLNCWVGEWGWREEEFKNFMYLKFDGFLKPFSKSV